MRWTGERVVGRGPALQSLKFDRAEIRRPEQVPNPFGSNYQERTDGNGRYHCPSCKNRKHDPHPNDVLVVIDILLALFGKNDLPIVVTKVGQIAIVREVEELLTE